MFRREFTGLPGLLLVAGWAFPGAARAQPVMSSLDSSCGKDNLLAGKRPAQWQDLRGDATLLTDGALAPEGAQWDAPVAVILDTGAGSVTYDLGQPTPIAALYLQADANDSYKIQGSLDGRPGSYKLLVEIDNASDRGHGLRARSLQIPPMPVRFLRVGEGVGDGFYSISEFAAYCQVPIPFPPAMRQVAAPLAAVVVRPWYRFDWWEDHASARVEMAIALGALLLLAWGYWLRRYRLEAYKAKLRDRLLMLVGVLSFLAYWNFGAFHFGNYTHYWDTYHYYIGSKYFEELSYDRLYDCASVADSEDPALRRRVELRKIMNLRTNVLAGTADVLAHPERCKQHFSPERWAKFKKDIEFFRNRHGVKRWEEAQTDHGYNGTPVWNIVGTTLANLSPASDRQLWFLTRIDPAFIVGMALMIWWAFGWRTLCVALAVFATNFPSRFYWTGGAYLRWDWLFHMTAGVCLIKKNRPVFGGYLIAYSALLRVFPGLLFLGPLFVIVQQLLGQLPQIFRQTSGQPWWRRLPPRELPLMFRRVDRGHLAVILGAALAVGTLVPLSLRTSSGVAGYRAFLQNSKKHTSTPLTNYMGWRTVVTYSQREAGRYLRTDRLEDPWKDWKDARLRTFHHRKWAYLAGVLGFAALLYRAVRASLRGRRPRSARS